MARCPSCGEPIERLNEACPACSLPLDFTADRLEDRDPVASSPAEAADDDDSLVTVARFANAAEAGYFAEELFHHSNIPTQLRSDKSFNALSGYWSQRFELLVPETDVNEAEATLRQLIEQTGGREPVSENPAANFAPPDDSALPSERFDADLNRSDDLSGESKIHWVPIVLTLTAGTVAFWAARRIHHVADNGRRPASAKLSPAGLWNRLSAVPQPWRQTLPNGRGVRELQFGSARQRAVLREDADGDGFFEHEELIERTLPK